MQTVGCICAALQEVWCGCNHSPDPSPDPAHAPCVELRLLIDIFCRHLCTCMSAVCVYQILPLCVRVRMLVLTHVAGNTSTLFCLDALMCRLQVLA